MEGKDLFRSLQRRKAFKRAVRPMLLINRLDQIVDLEMKDVEEAREAKKEMSFSRNWYSLIELQRS